MAKIPGTPAGPTRLGYTLATGGSLPGTDTSSKTTPRYAKGGRVKAGGFRQGVVTTAAKAVGTVPSTNIRHKGSQLAPGFKKHAPKKI